MIDFRINESVFINTLTTYFSKSIKPLFFFIEKKVLPCLNDVVMPFRCRQSVDFSLKCAWLLESYSSDASVPLKKKPHGVQLRNLILSDKLRPKDQKFTASFNANTDKLVVPVLLVKKTHQRSQSDASALITAGLRRSNSAAKLCLGDLSTGKAFDNGCFCFDTCQGVVNDLRGKKTDCCCSVSWIWGCFLVVLIWWGF